MRLSVSLATVILISSGFGLSPVQAQQTQPDAQHLIAAINAVVAQRNKAEDEAANAAANASEQIAALTKQLADVKAAAAKVDCTAPDQKAPPEAKP